MLWLGPGELHGFVQIKTLERCHSFDHAVHLFVLCSFRFETMFVRRYNHKRGGRQGYQNAVVEGILRARKRGNTDSEYYENALARNPKTYKLLTGKVSRVVYEPLGFWESPAAYW